MAVPDEQGEVAYVLYGPSPDRCPSSARSELWGVIHAVRRAEPPLAHALDNLGVVEDYARGKAFCTDSTRPAADLWRCLWRLLEAWEGGAPGLTLVWNKGHATDADLARGLTTPERRRLNEACDTWAEEGARLAAAASPAQPLVDSYEQGVALGQVLCKLAINWPADTVPLPPPPPCR